MHVVYLVGRHIGGRRGERKLFRRPKEADLVSVGAPAPLFLNDGKEEGMVLFGSDREKARERGKITQKAVQAKSQAPTVAPDQGVVPMLAPSAVISAPMETKSSDSVDTVEQKVDGVYWTAELDSMWIETSLLLRVPIAR